MDGSYLHLNHKITYPFAGFHPPSKIQRQASLQLKQDSLPGVGLLRLQINALQQGPNFAPFLGESSEGGR